MTATFDATDDAVVQCPYPHYREMRNESPVLELDGTPFGRRGERLWHATTVVIDAQGSIVASARPLGQDFIVADVALDGLRGGTDGDLFGRANASVTDQFRALWD